jgi:hypothetical protein
MKGIIMEKVIRDGKVGVIYSPDYGAGWFSWNKESPEIMFDPNLINFLENDEEDKLRAYMELKYPDVFVSEYGLDLVVEWLPVGTEFKIEEYDGAESLILKEKEVWLIA